MNAKTRPDCPPRAIRLATRLVVTLIGTMVGAQVSQAQVVLEGRITDSTGAPISDADLDFFESQSGFKVDPSAPGWESQSDKTDVFGYYSMVVVPEVYDVRFEPPEPRTDLAAVIERQLILGTDQVLDVTLPAGSRLTGLVVDSSGRSVDAVDLDFHDPRGGGKLPTVRDDTAADGTYGTTVIPGVWDVSFRPPLRSGVGPLRVHGVDLTTNATLDVVLPPGYVVSGRVVRSEGPSVYFADLDFEDPDGARRIPTADDATQQDGSFEVNVSEGTRHVFVTPPRGLPYAPAALYDVVVDRDVDLGTITLVHGAVLQGTVQDANGAPVAGADVDIFVPGSCDRYPAVTDGTDPSGSFSLRVEPGTYDFVVTPANGDPRPAHRFPSVAITADGAVDFPLPATPVFAGDTASRVLDGTRRPVADAVVTGTPLGAGTDWSATTDPDGSFTFDAIPGRYDVLVSPRADSGLALLRLDAVELPCALASVLTLRSAPTIAVAAVRERVLFGFPNPWTTSTSLDLTLPGPSPSATVIVYDVSGRRVRELHRGALPDVHTRFDWDGRDSRGRSVSSGIYLVRVDTPSAGFTTKLVKIRS